MLSRKFLSFKSKAEYLSPECKQMNEISKNFSISMRYKLFCNFCKKNRKIPFPRRQNRHIHVAHRFERTFKTAIFRLPRKALGNNDSPAPESCLNVSKTICYTHLPADAAGTAGFFSPPASPYLAPPQTSRFLIFRPQAYVALSHPRSIKKAACIIKKQAAFRLDEHTIT